MSNAGIDKKKGVELQMLKVELQNIDVYLHSALRWLIFDGSESHKSDQVSAIWTWCDWDLRPISIFLFLK